MAVEGPQASATPRERAARGEEPATAPAGRDEGLRDAAPGLARIAVSAWWNSAGWAAGATMRSGERVMRAATSGRAPADLLSRPGTDVREYARRLLGLLDGEGGSTQERGAAGEDGERPRETLRERGAELLRRSADVHFDEDLHPAYERILAQLAPDEARILRLLAQGGPQPSVDVRSGWLPFGIASQLVAPGLTMIGAEAGCRYPDRIHAYLNNLFRLGLVWFSREPIADPLSYQVLEAQPEVVEALKQAGRGQTLRRSIHLTPFGEDFCEACLPLDTAEFEAVAGSGREPVDAGPEAEPAAAGPEAEPAAAGREAEPAATPPLAAD